MHRPRRTPPKQIGELAEVAFLHKAVRMGLIVAAPFGDSAPFDSIVVHRRKVSRIQVKSASKFSKGKRYYCVSTSWKRDTVIGVYSKRDIDFVVAYIIPEDTWYIFPPRVFHHRKTILIHPADRKKKHRYRAWRERWDLLFDRSAAGLTIHAAAECSSPSVARRSRVTLRSLGLSPVCVRRPRPKGRGGLGLYFFLPWEDFFFVAFLPAGLRAGGFLGAEFFFVAAFPAGAAFLAVSFFAALFFGVAAGLAAAGCASASLPFFFAAFPAFSAAAGAASAALPRPLRAAGGGGGGGGA